MESHYQILGVPPGANQEQIKAAYRRRALRLHPDKRPDDPNAALRFKRCSEAYAVLSQKERRGPYDISQLVEGGPSELVGGLVSDLLGRRFRRKKRGRNLQYTLELGLEEVAVGAIRRTIEFFSDEPCGACGGIGAANGGQRSCEDCNGRGFMPKAGLISLPQPCHGCGGSGKRTVRMCRPCDGVGMVERRREFRVSLPRGVRDGELKIVSGQGESGQRGGASGDLHVRVKVGSHALFRRQGADLRLRLPISFAQAALGGSCIVPVPGGEVRMRIPRGVQSGAVFRIRGKGAAKGGDLLAEVVVETPVGLGARERTLFEELEHLCDQAGSPLQAAFRATVDSLAETRQQDDARRRAEGQPMALAERTADA